MEQTPKEKAKELIDKYKFVEIANYTSMFEVKQCAILEIEGRIEELKSNIEHYKNEFYCISKMVFLQEVKQEINNL